MQAERDELYAKFEASIYDVQQKTGLKSALLEKKVEVSSTCGNGWARHRTLNDRVLLPRFACCSKTYTLRPESHRYTPRYVTTVRCAQRIVVCNCAVPHQALGEALELKEAQLAEVLTAANLDPGTLASINARLEEVLDNKNQVRTGAALCSIRGWGGGCGLHPKGYAVPCWGLCMPAVRRKRSRY